MEAHILAPVEHPTVKVRITKVGPSHGRPVVSCERGDSCCRSRLQEQSHVNRHEERYEGNLDEEFLARGEEDL